MKRSLERKLARDTARQDAERLASWLSSEPPRYKEWLHTIFGVFDEVGSSEEIYDAYNSVSFHASDEDVARLYLKTLSCSGKDLAGYSDLALARGLRILLDSDGSDLVYQVVRGSTPLAMQADIIRTFSSLYADCLQSRVAPMLAHINEHPAGDGASDLHGTCYMIWDITPLCYWPDQKQAAALTPVFLDMLEQVIMTNTNQACIESAMHGLGHAMDYQNAHGLEGLIKTRRSEIIDRFLTARQDADADLRAYARAVRTGMIQ